MPEPLHINRVIDGLAAIQGDAAEIHEFDHLFAQFRRIGYWAACVRSVFQ